jgi:hypothetical protein
MIAPAIRIVLSHAFTTVANGTVNRRIVPWVRVGRCCKNKTPIMRKGGGGCCRAHSDDRTCKRCAPEDKLEVISITKEAVHG